VNIIIMRVKSDEKQIVFATMHVYKVYNLFSKDYETIYDKRNLLIIEITLHISSESVLIKDFNLYYAI